MLQIGVHNHTVVSGCMPKARIHSRLLPEIAGKGEIIAAGVFGKLSEDTKRMIPASVVYKDKFHLGLRNLFHHLTDLSIEKGKGFLLIIAGNNDADFIHAGRPLS